MRLARWLTAGSGGAVAGRYALAILSGLLIGLPYLHPTLFAAAWVAFVPLLFAIERSGVRQTYLLGMVAGITAWLAITYWMATFITKLKGYELPWNAVVAVVFWIYAGQGFAIVALSFQWLRRKRVLHEAALLPSLVVAVLTLYPTLFYGGLAGTQSRFLAGLQGLAFTGPSGLDFAIAMSSVLIYRVLRGAPERGDRIALSLGAAALALWLAYGVFSVQAWDRAASDWSTKRLGIVQPNDEVSIDIPPPEPGYSRSEPRDMEASRRLVRDGAELVIWPEVRFKGYFYHDHVREAYRRQVAEMETPLLFHDLERERPGDETLYYNTVALLDERGELVGKYRKIKRVMFGEYAPAIAELPVVRPVVRYFFGDFVGAIRPGDDHVTVRAAGMELVPKVCYESAFPRFIAAAFEDDPRGKVLVVHTQDGWFGRTRMPFQHLETSVLRAVENRVPLVHAINNGPIGVFLPNGRAVFRSTPFVEDEYIVELPYSPQSGGSFYSRHAGWFSWTVFGVLGGTLLRLLAVRWRRGGKWLRRRLRSRGRRS